MSELYMDKPAALATTHLQNRYFMAEAAGLGRPRQRDVLSDMKKGVTGLVQERAHPPRKTSP